MPRKSRPLKFPNHRKPPKPMSWDIPRGNCRFCGGEIVEDGKQNRRKHWHQKCADKWRVMNDPAEAKKKVFVRERGKCQSCDFQSILMKDFDLDHVKPLFEAFGDLSYYGDENMQLLCKTCHREKTRLDMKHYHELQKIDFPDRP